ncbi:hypothetical protein O0L34_g16594 [Tuta absoluta]|nr:hypothetical protein O0L34_g16594 [Tuta absoluta]
MNKCLLFFLMMSVAITSLVMASPTPSVWPALVRRRTVAPVTVVPVTVAPVTDTAALNTDTAALNTDTAALNTDTAALNTDTAALNTDTAALEPDQGAVVKRSKRATDNELLAFTGGMAGGGATVGLVTCGPAGAVAGAALGALTGSLISLYKLSTR